MGNMWRCFFGVTSGRCFCFIRFEKMKLVESCLVEVRCRQSDVFVLLMQANGCIWILDNNGPGLIMSKGHAQISPVRFYHHKVIG